MCRYREATHPVDLGDRALRRHAGSDQLGSPQPEDVALATLDFLAHDHVDAELIGMRRRLQCTLIGVVVADRDDRQVGLLGDPLEHLDGRRGAVGCGGVEMQVCGSELHVHGGRC